MAKLEGMTSDAGWIDASFFPSQSVPQDAAQGHAQLEGGGIWTPGNVSLTNASLMFERASLRKQWSSQESSDIHEM